jgi:integrase/recombinase XerD
MPQSLGRGGIVTGCDMKIRLRHLVEDTDRHGNVRCYLRLPGKPKIRVRGTPGTEEFMVNYHAALSAASGAPRQARVAARGSFRFLCQGYFASATFKGLDIST